MRSRSRVVDDGDVVRRQPADQVLRALAEPRRAVHLRRRARRTAERSRARRARAWMSGMRPSSSGRLDAMPSAAPSARILRGLEQPFGVPPGRLVARVGAQHAAQLLDELARGRAARRPRGPRRRPRVRVAQRLRLLRRRGSGACASDATCGRCVMQRTWRPSDSARRRSPTARAVAPPTPASTSSNTTVGEPSTAVATLISASITRDSSPPEAISRSGPGGHAGVRADQELDGVAPAAPNGPAAPRRRSAAPRPRTSNVASAIASSASSAHTAFASAPAALLARRAQPRRQLVERARRAASSSASSRAVVSLGVREPVALGAAALGVLEHRCDRAAVLSLQPRELLEALLDRREALRVRLQRVQVGAQLARRCPAARRRPPPRATRARRAPRRCRPRARSSAAAPRQQRHAPRQSVAPGSSASAAAEAAWRSVSTAPSRPRSRSSSASSSSAGRDGLDLARSRTRGSRGRAPARRAAPRSSVQLALDRAGRRQAALELGAHLEVLARRRTRRGSRAAPRRPSACGARAGRRRRPAASATARSSCADTERPCR